MDSSILFKEKLNKDDYCNALFEGDCLDVMPLLPDGCVDMVLCDLPYGTTQNAWDSIIPFDKLWHSYRRVVKRNGAIVLTSQGIFTAKLIVSNELEFKYKIVWEKSKPTNFLNAKKQPLRKHEDICVFYRCQPTYTPQMTIGKPYSKGMRKHQQTGSYRNYNPNHGRNDSGMRYPIDLVKFNTPESEGSGTVWHSTQKPVELGRYLIRTYTAPGDIVLDNTCGSGSFLVAALMEGRNFIGIEKNQNVLLFRDRNIDLIDVAKARLREVFNDFSDSILPEYVSQTGILKEFIEADNRSQISKNFKS